MKGHPSRMLMKEKIATAETQMKAKLQEARAAFVQPGDRGISGENAFRTFLGECLPNRLRLRHGEIIDFKGRRSKQTDVVIASEDHPFTFSKDLPGLFFVEGVTAAGEVKAVLTSSELEEALEASRQFKRLEMEIPVNTLFTTNDSDRKRFLICPPWFLFAFESQLTLPSILAKIDQFVKENEIQNNRLADALFLLDRGWVINFGDGRGGYCDETPDGARLEGWQCKESNSVLFDFLGWLHAVMPRMISFSSIFLHYILPEYPVRR